MNGARDRSPFAAITGRARIIRAFLALVIGMALVTGCTTVGPDYKTPPAPSVTGYTGKTPRTITPSTNDSLSATQTLETGQPVAREWWRTFHSARLDKLVAHALDHSPTLAASEAALRAARLLYDAQTGSTRYPTVDATVGASRNAINSASYGGSNSSGYTYNVFRASINVAYDFDLFGGNRRALEALAAQADYQRFQLAGARLALAGNVVVTAFDQARLAEQIAATEEILNVQKDELAIARKRFALGATSKVDVLTLETQVQQTRASIPRLRNQMEQANNLLAVLTGQAPGEAEVPQFTLADFTLPARLPLVIPSELVRQRPDIQASTALLHVATAQYDVVISKLYPRIDLSATLGKQALTTGALFGPGSMIWNLAGQLAQPLFNRGTRPGIRAGKARLQEAGAEYQETVLQALRSVADVLRQIDNDAEALEARSAAAAAAAESLDLVKRQYQLGAVSYLQLLTAEQQVQETRLGVIAAQAARLADSAALYQAVGGGVLAPRAAPKGSKPSESTPAKGEAVTQRSDR